MPPDKIPVGINTTNADINATQNCTGCEPLKIVRLFDDYFASIYFKHSNLLKVLMQLTQEWLLQTSRKPHRLQPEVCLLDQTYLSSYIVGRKCRQKMPAGY